MAHLKLCKEHLAIAKKFKDITNDTFEYNAIVCDVCVERIKNA